jgi:hypothetical protein
MGKIKLGPQWTGAHHRSGWAYAISSLQHLHSDNGIMFDGFIEQKFVWERDDGAHPYREPWIGFFHNPPYVPHWFGPERSAEDIIASSLWRESLPDCRGLFTLSKYLADWLRPRVPVPVCSLFHPTEPCAEQFSMEKYYNNEYKRIIHIGWWLRKIHSFFLLRTRSAQKVLIAPISKQELSLYRPWTRNLLLTERRIAEQHLSNGSVLQHFEFELHRDNDSYDRLLSSNIVFIDLYDSSANNTIVECVVRNTPLVVNRHPAIVEYLGKDYPLFFDTIEEASVLVEHDRQIHAAYSYLRDHQEIKERLTKEWFIREFTNSPIYEQLSP